jgi:hypothetical protein
MEFVQLPRGNPKVLFSGITASATSPMQEIKGHNAMILFLNLTAGAGTWTIKIQGRVPETDTYIDMYDINNILMGISGAAASKAKFIAGLPEQFKVVATEDVNGATVSVAYQLISV